MVWGQVQLSCFAVSLHNSSQTSCNVLLHLLHSPQARPAPHTRKAGAECDNDDQTFEDDLVNHRRQEPSQQR